MKDWRGIPREDIPWFPTIDQEKCVGCKTCIEFCKNEVLTFDEETGNARVVNPYNCVVECQTCARLCPADAITFPDEEEFSACIKKKLAGRKDGAI